MSKRSSAICIDLVILVTVLEEDVRTSAPTKLFKVLTDLSFITYDAV